MSPASAGLELGSTSMLLGAALVLIRSTSLVVSVPIFGTSTVPARVRLAFGLSLGFAAWVAAGSPSAPPMPGVSPMLAAVAVEASLGLGTGLATRFAMTAASSAGSFMGMSMGLGFGALVDPISGTSAPVISRLLELLVLAAAVAAGLHKQAVLWLAASVAALPPGGELQLGLLGHTLITQAVGAIVLAYQLGFPVVATVTVGHLILGMMGRVAPQLNLMSVGFSIGILAGGFALYLSAPLLVQVVARAAFLPLALP